MTKTNKKVYVLGVFVDGTPIKTEVVRDFIDVIEHLHTMVRVSNIGVFEDVHMQNFPLQEDEILHLSSTNQSGYIKEIIVKKGIVDIIPFFNDGEKGVSN